MKRKAVLLGGLFHESHTFLEGVSPLEECQVRVGDAILAEAGDSSPLAGALKAAGRAGWEVIPAADVRAMPGPPVADEVLEFFWQKLKAAATQRPLDGVFLVLHGAMVSESVLDVEGEILGRLRQLPGLESVPVGGVLDLHANFSDAMGARSNALAAYRNNPHTDAFEAAVRAAEILDGLLETGKAARTVWERTDILWPPTGTATAEQPLAAICTEARALEAACPSILAVNVMPGFAFADVEEAGLSFSAVTTGEPDEARAGVRHLRKMAWDMRHQGNVIEQPVDEVMEAVKRAGSGPVVVAEPSDNVGAGAPGDGTGLLRAFLRFGVMESVVVINDPEAVRGLAAGGVGDIAEIDVGGKGSALDEGPVALRARIMRKTDGRFTLEDAHSHLASMFGSRIDMGPCVLLQQDGVSVLLTSRKTPPFDLGQLRSQGIAPERMRAIGVKAAVAHRRAYDPIAALHLAADTPGPCSSNLRRLPYRRVRRPVFPLDEETL